MSAKPLCLLGILLAIGPGPLQAHDIYMGLLSQTGLPCCNNTDCHPAHYRLTLSGVQMFIDGLWIHIPSYRVQYRALEGDRGETRGGHWCGDKLAEFEGLGTPVYFTRCAILPPQLTSASHIAPE